jgi:hypothetical protein
MISKVWSACLHGPTSTLVEHLRPLLEQYEAHYFSGHDHCHEHIVEEGKMHPRYVESLI